MIKIIDLFLLKLMNFNKYLFKFEFIINYLLKCLKLKKNLNKIYKLFILIKKFLNKKFKKGQKQNTPSSKKSSLHLLLFQ